MKKERKGAWVPDEIWQNKALNVVERHIVSEIDSLDQDEEKGCFASNNHFAEFIGISESRIAHIISSLKKKGIVEVIFNNGRNRGLRVNKKAAMLKTVKVICRKQQNRTAKTTNSDVENDNADLLKTTNLACRKRQHNNTVSNSPNNSNELAAVPPTENLKEENSKPKQPKNKKKGKVGPDVSVVLSKPPTIPHQMIEIFTRFHAEVHGDEIPLVPKPRDYSHMKNILKTLKAAKAKKGQLKPSEVSNDEGVAAFEILLTQFLAKGSKFMKQNWMSPAMIDSKFNEIITHITSKVAKNEQGQANGISERRFRNQELLRQHNQRSESVG